jgi:ABC-type amino acid transport substrate-binding protein
VRKDEVALLDAFNRALRQIRADGTFKQINDKYFAFDIGAP